MKQAILVPVEGPIQHFTITGDEYETLRACVDGWIESVPLPDFIEGAGQCSAYINETGKILGLTPNMKATDFFVPGVGLFMGDYIAGPMVLIGFDPTTGESADTVPPAVVRRIEKINREAN